MRYSFYLCLFILASCSGNSEISKQLSGSDSLVINFNQPATNLIEKTMTTTESKAIKQLKDLVDGGTREVGPCPFDGNLMFFKNGELKGDIAFAIDSCKMFVMKSGQDYIATQMSNKAIDLLNSLKQGKGWY